MDNIAHHDIRKKEKAIDIIFSEEDKGLPYGIPALESVIRIRPQRLAIIGAETGMGKTQLSLNLAVGLAKQGIKTCYLDLENFDAEITHRVVRLWNEGKEDISTKEGFLKVFRTIRNIEYFNLDDVAKVHRPVGIESLKKIIIPKAKEGVKVFFIDPLTALTHDDTKLVLGYIVQDLRNIAQLHEITIIINHHTNKGKKNQEEADNLNLRENKDLKRHKYRIPGDGDLRGDGKIADFATDIWFFVRQRYDEDEENRGICLVICHKNRGKDTDRASVYLDKDTGLITSIGEWMERRKAPAYRSLTSQIGESKIDELFK